MKKLILLSFFYTFACAHSYQPPPPVAVKNDTLGSYNNNTIDVSDAIQAISEPWRELQNDHAQRELQLLWVGFEQVVEERLLKAEAQRRKISVDELLKQEIDHRIVAPKEAEVRALYDNNRKQINLTFEKAEPALRAELLHEKQASLKRVLIDGLRRDAKIKYQFSIPTLPKYPVASDHSPSKGPKNAPITVTLFADFQCAFCVSAHALIDMLQKLYPHDLRIVFKHYPLPQHSQAKDAAKAAYCAYEQQQFWSFHDKLFANNNALSSEYFKRYAKELNLNIPTFEQCLQSQRGDVAIAEDIEQGKKLGVTGTPALFLNQTKLIGLLPLPLMQAFIENELR